MNKKILGISAVTLAFAGIAGMAVAGDGPRRGPDADGNRTVTRAEMLAHADTMFTRMDANKDGKIDSADREARHAERFDAMDTDKNGQISRAEFTAAHAAMGQRGMNDDGPPAGGPGMMGDHQRGDGHRMGGRGMRGHHGGGRGGEDGRMGGGMGGGGMGRMMLTMADTNKDGAVTKAEFTAATTSHFDQVDTSHDGQITREERQAAHAAMRERMKAAPAPTAPPTK